MRKSLKSLVSSIHYQTKRNLFFLLLITSILMLANLIQVASQVTRMFRVMRHYNYVRRCKMIQYVFFERLMIQYVTYCNSFVKLQALIIILFLLDNLMCTHLSLSTFQLLSILCLEIEVLSTKCTFKQS